MGEEEIQYYKIVGWDGCPHCEGAYDLLTTIGEEVHLTYHARGSQALQEAKDKNNWSTVPMITHVRVVGEDTHETFVGGFDDLKKRIEGVGGSLG